MKYAVDKVEDDIVLLEKDGVYLKDDKEKEDRIKVIKAKMEALRKKE